MIRFYKAFLLPLLTFLATSGHYGRVKGNPTGTEHQNNAFQSTSKLKGGSLRRLESFSTNNLEVFNPDWERKKTHDSDSSEDCDRLRDKHGITCAPSQRPSSVPSVSPSLSIAPSVSAVPSARPSASPTTSPTSTPSVSPSRSPSTSPSLPPTNAPTTNVPTMSPSNEPSPQPSFQPTLQPSEQPSVYVPRFNSLVLSREDGSIWQENTCQDSIPVTASKPQAEETMFQYYLFVKPNANAEESMKQVEQALATNLLREVLDCRFDDNRQQQQQRQAVSPSFDVYAISSLPMDTISERGCPEDVLQDASDCYIIRAGLTPTVFYHQQSNLNTRNRERSLKYDRAFETQSQSEVVDYFGPVLQRLLDDNTFVGGDVLGTQYSGFILDDDAFVDLARDGTFSTTTSSAIQESDNDTPGDLKLIGGVVVGLAAVALVAVAAVLVQRRKENKLNETFEEVADDSELDDGAVKDKYDTENIQEGFPRENTRYIHEVPMEMEGIEVGANENFHASRNGDLRFSVVNDEATYDQSFDESFLAMDASLATDTHNYENCRTENCFKCKNRGIPQPIFVKADIQAIQADLGSNKKYRPKYDRKYAASDTVDL